MAPRRDHYAVLGVPREATQRQIQVAFRGLARQYHPDANRTDPDAERHFKRVARAYEVLGNAARRRAYDERSTRGRFGAPGSGGPASFEVDSGPIYHSDLGHHSDFYRAGDPLTVAEAAALVNRTPAWIRRAIRERRLAAEKGPTGYLVRRRQVEQLDRTAPRREAPPREAAARAGQSAADAAREDGPG